MLEVAHLQLVSLVVPVLGFVLATIDVVTVPLGIERTVERTSLTNRLCYEQT